MVGLVVTGPFGPVQKWLEWLVDKWEVVLVERGLIVGNRRAKHEVRVHVSVIREVAMRGMQAIPILAARKATGFLCCNYSSALPPGLIVLHPNFFLDLVLLFPGLLQLRHSPAGPARGEVPLQALGLVGHLVKFESLHSIQPDDARRVSLLIHALAFLITDRVICIHTSIMYST